MEDHKLELGADKTKVVILEPWKKVDREKPRFSLNGILLKPQRELKYLGIVLKNVGSKNFKMLRVVRSTLLYGAPMFADAVNIGTFMKPLQNREDPTEGCIKAGVYLQDSLIESNIGNYVKRCQ